MKNETGHWMPFYWADYFADTTHLSTEEHGAYLLLIGAYWRRAAPLPDDHKFLAGAAKLSRQRWGIIKNVVGAFFEIEGGVWKHKRIDLEILKSTERLNSARANGRAGGLAKSYLPTTTPTKEVSNNLSFNGGGSGKKNGLGNGVTILDPAERLARFQKWLADQIPGGQGWLLVSAAADPAHKDHAASLAFCKAEAKRHGKGWPKQWPSSSGQLVP